MAVGQKGLSINNPEQNHHLQLYRGGTTISAARSGRGFDFAREYELAKGMVGVERKA